MRTRNDFLDINKRIYQNEFSSLWAKCKVTTSNGKKIIKPLNPTRDDRNPGSFVVYIDEYSYFDHATNDKGDMIDLLSKMNGIDKKDIIFSYSDSKPTKEKKSKTEKYLYYNPDGTKNKIVLRTDTKNGKSFIQQFFDGERQVNSKDSIKNYKSVLYNILQVKKSRSVIIVEGEKKAQLLIDLGFCATTSGSSNSWEDDFKYFLKNKSVYIIPDNDEAGFQYADTIQKSIADVCKFVRVLKLKSNIDKYDIYDFFTENGKDETVKLIDRLKRESAIVIDEIKEEIFPKLNFDHLFTEDSMAKRVVFYFQNSIRYGDSIGFYVWDGSRWTRDIAGKRFEYVRQTIDKLSKERNAGVKKIESSIEELSAKIKTTDSESDKSKFIQQKEKLEEKAKILYREYDKLIKKSSTDNGIRKICSLLTHYRDIQFTITDISDKIASFDIDSNPLLLNLENGTFDFDTMVFREHNKNDNITKKSPIVYDSKSECPRWIEFLNTITEKDESVIGYIQKLFGYSLTGLTDFEAFWFLYGTGANGKTVLVETYIKLLGEYAAIIPTETLMAKNFRGSEATPDLAKLRGTRAVFSSETEEGSYFNDSRIKSLTGGETITVRFLHENPFSFRPQFKLFIVGNHQPGMRGTSEGEKRRVNLIPFNYTIPKEKRMERTKLDDILHSELPGILNWCIEGFRKYKSDGMQKPKTISEKTDSYLKDNDTIQSFIDEYIEINEKSIYLKSEIYNLYKDFCESIPKSEKSFTKIMKEKIPKLTDRRVTTGMIWEGICLNSDGIDRLNFLRDESEKLSRKP